MVDQLKESLRNSEYEVQLFSTSSFCVIQQLKVLTQNDVKTVTEAMRKKMISRCANPDDISKCDHLIQRLRAKYEIAVNACFNDMEPQISKIFNIPSHILLPEDVAQKDQCSADDLRKVDDEIEALKSRYRRAICMKSLLEKEKKVSSNVDIIEQKALKVEENIKILIDAHEKSSLQRTSLTDELIDLKNLVNQICPLSSTEYTPHEYLAKKLLGHVV